MSVSRLNYRVNSKSFYSRIRRVLRVWVMVNIRGYFYLILIDFERMKVKSASSEPIRKR